MKIVTNPPADQALAPGAARLNHWRQPRTTPPSWRRATLSAARARPRAAGPRLRLHSHAPPPPLAAVVRTFGEAP
jgi:hypothetical protein